MAGSRTMKNIISLLFLCTVSVIPGLYAQSAPGFTISSGLAPVTTRACSNVSNVGSIYTQLGNPSTTYVCSQTGPSVSGLSNGGVFVWTSIGSPVACVGTPGNTTGAYRQQCQTSTGVIYACNNTAGCGVAGDWVAGGGGSGTPAPYTLCASGCSTTIPASPFAVTAVTHGQGKYPYVFAYNSSNQPTAINWTIDTSGNLTAITYTGTLSLVVIASGAGTAGTAGATGPTGPTGSNGTNGTNGAISQIYNNGSAQTVQPFVNLISGTNATVTCVNNGGATRTDCTVAATSGGTTVT